MPRTVVPPLDLAAISTGSVELQLPSIIDGSMSRQGCVSADVLWPNDANRPILDYEIVPTLRGEDTFRSVALLADGRPLAVSLLESKSGLTARNCYVFRIDIRVHIYLPPVDFRRPCKALRPVGDEHGVIAGADKVTPPDLNGANEGCQRTTPTLASFDFYENRLDSRRFGSKSNGERSRRPIIDVTDRNRRAGSRGERINDN